MSIALSKKVKKEFFKNILQYMKKCDRIIKLQKYRGIAQLVEQRSPKPRVQSSNLCAPAKLDEKQIVE